MHFYLLGAGKPTKGVKPASLHKVALGTRALDWQLNSVSSILNKEDIHFLGGYHANEINTLYPELNISYIPDWERSGPLNTLIHAPFDKKECLISYSDTIFRKEVLEHISTIEADVVVGVDFKWQDRYEKRTEKDISNAETLDINGNVVEFTGLIKLSPRAVMVVSDVDINYVGTSLLDLISLLKGLGMKVEYYDVAKNWAEFNSPDDVAHFVLGTKAETLARLEGVVSQSVIGKQVSFTTSEWAELRELIIVKIQQKYDGQPLVIRSSSKGEDNWYSSNAGGFDSILNVCSKSVEEISTAVDKVIASYGSSQNGDDQVLVQKFLNDVKASGVVFTCSLETGAPYYRINFDDKTNSTESVTAGFDAELRTIIIHKDGKHYIDDLEPKLKQLITAISELEVLLNFDKLDIEFAIDNNGIVHIFQVRPITVDHTDYNFSDEMIQQSLFGSGRRFKELENSMFEMNFEQTIFANMPDWNPAEIIGTKPRPLSLSMYQELITNKIWAVQRKEFGYKDLTSYPLLYSFSGQPYIDTRVSFCSFIPESLNNECTQRIVNAYLNILKENPCLHDKVEFDIAFTIWTPDIQDKACARLIPYGVKKEDINELEAGLKIITRNALKRLEDDITSINTLVANEKLISDCNLSSIDRLHLLIEDCKKFGTLAFSHAARAGFVAMTLLNYFVEKSIFTKERKLDLLKSFDTVAGEFERDKFLFKNGDNTLDYMTQKYGHLRPGTYSLLNQAYWENPELYFSLQDNLAIHENQKFNLKAQEREQILIFLGELGSDLTPEEVLDYLIQATIQREEVKFHFTKNLSKALDLCVDIGKEFDITRDDMTYLSYSNLLDIKLGINGIETLKEKIENNKRLYQVTSVIELPPLISSHSDFYCFERLASLPNFISNARTQAPLVLVESESEKDLKGKVVLIPQADPGYDWLFGQGIAGLITKYGGANSHMAIRAAEMGLPAAIGVGEKLYEIYRHYHKIELDCLNNSIREI